MALIRYPLELEIIVSPGTQIQDFKTLEEKIEMVKPFVKSIHLDFLDGKFVNNKNFMDPEPFKKYAQDLILEAHFMTDNPIQYLKSFAACGFKRFIGQVEKMPDIPEFVAQGQLLGEVGLAIDGPTSLDAIVMPLDDLDVVLIYTGESAGFSGATLLPERLEKVQELRSKDPLVPIEVDGGINDQTIVLAKQAGVTRFVTTGFIYAESSPEMQFKILKKLVETS